MDTSKPRLASSLAGLLQSLGTPHSAALTWYFDNAGNVTAWPKPLLIGTERVLLATKAKGIYKPIWSRYALSVRHSLKTQYPDGEPVFRPDGSWRYDYYQEGLTPEERDRQFTNRALLLNAQDEVPVGVLMQLTGRPKQSYRILGLGIVEGWREGHFALRSLQATR